MPIDIIITQDPVSDASMAFIENITNKVDGVFSWTIDAIGGFATAHIEMVVPEADAWQMLERIGKRIVFLSPDAPDKSLICWEGRIFSVNVDDGGASIGRSLETCFNRVSVSYSTVDTTTTPPTVGLRATTAVTNETASQALYGIRELRFSIGGSTASDAVVLRNRMLTQYAFPLAVTTTMRRGGGSSASSIRVTVECVGFIEELAVRFYTSATNVSQYISTMIGNVIATPLQFIANDITGITANSLLASDYQDEDINIRSYFSRFVSWGDGATGRQSLYGVYENRKFYYTVAPNAVGYYTRRGDPSEAIIDATTGAEVKPWLVRPGVIIEVPDIMPDETVETSILANARRFLIGNVEFTAPATVILGTEVFDSAQMFLARIGNASTGLDITPLPPIPR